MGLLDDIVSEGRPGGRVMRLDQILADLSEKDRADLTEALGDPHRYSHAQITRALNKNGHEVTQGSVRAWRIKHGV